MNIKIKIKKISYFIFSLFVKKNNLQKKEDWFPCFRTNSQMYIFFFGGGDIIIDNDETFMYGSMLEVNNWFDGAPSFNDTLNEVSEMQYIFVKRYLDALRSKNLEAIKDCLKDYDVQFGELFGKYFKMKADPKELR